MYNVVGRPLLLWQRHFGKFGLFFEKIAHESSCMPDRPDMFGPTSGDDQRGRALLPRQRHLRQARSLIAYRLVIIIFLLLYYYIIIFFHVWYFRLNQLEEASSLATDFESMRRELRSLLSETECKLNAVDIASTDSVETMLNLLQEAKVLLID